MTDEIAEPKQSKQSVAEQESMPEQVVVGGSKKLSKREKKRRARKALLLFLKNMRRSCSMYGTAQDWYGEMKRLKSILEQFTDVLPDAPLKKVNAAMELTDLTNKGISKTCKILRHDLRKLAKKLPMMGGVSSLLVKGLVTVAVIAGGSSIFWQANKVKLTIENKGCSNIPVAREVPQDLTKLLKTLGMKLPLWIATNGKETFYVPPATLAITAEGSALMVGFLGQSVQISVPENVSSITFNGRELLNTSTLIELRSSREHAAVVSCIW